MPLCLPGQKISKTIFTPLFSAVSKIYTLKLHHLIVINICRRILRDTNYYFVHPRDAFCPVRCKLSHLCWGGRFLNDLSVLMLISFAGVGHVPLFEQSYVISKNGRLLNSFYAIYLPVSSEKDMTLHLSKVESAPRILSLVPYCVNISPVVLEKNT